MDKSLLDTDILSEFLKGKNPLVSQRAAAYLAAHGRLTLSSVTVVEVVKGLHKQGGSQRVAAFLARLKNDEVVPLDFRAAVLAGKMFAELEAAGQTVGRADALIAGIAVANQLTLVTGNTQHFERIAALGYPLTLDNWRDA